MSLASLAIRGNVLDLVQHGDATQRLINRKGEAVRWKAEFSGGEAQLSVDGKPARTEHGTLPGGKQVSWTIVTVSPGASITVSR